MRHRGGEARAQLLVRGQVAAGREVDEPLAPTRHLVRDDERDDAGVPRQQPVGEPLALREPVDGLARPPARRDHAVLVVEHDDGLAALLEQNPATGGVGVHAHAVLTDA